MNNKPILSIIVPVYNVEKYLAKCLDSILAQTFTDFEVIAVNDGSLDNCGKILDEYSLKDSRIKVIHKENGGVSSARNSALDVAQGEYIGFVDPDDYISVDMYEHLMNEAKSGDYDIVQCNCALVGINGNISYYMDNIKSREYTDTKDMICAFFVNDIRDSSCNKIFKRNITTDVRFGRELRVAEDRLFVHDCLLNAKKIKITDKYCYYYVVSDSSVIHSQFDEKLFDDLKVLDILYELYKDNEEVLNSFRKHSAELTLDITLKVLASNRFSEKIPELIQRVLVLKDTVFKYNFSKIKKMFTFMLWIAPQITCRLTTAYLNRKK